MAAKVKWLLLSLIILSMSASVSAQSSAAGKDFWLAFPQNAKYEFGQTIKHLIVVTALESAEVAVTAPAIHGVGKSLATGIKLQKGESYTFDLDTALQCLTSEEIDDKGVHLGSTGLVTVIASSARKASNDSYRIMPADALGKEYMVVGYDPPSVDNAFTTQFTVIAADNNTTVRINLTSTTKGGRKGGDVIELKLDRGQCYTVQGKTSDATKDLTGSVVVADKPVAVLTGHSCAQVPSQFIYCDVLVEMAAPLNAAGTEFVVPMMEEKSGYALRVVATQPQTTVQLGAGNEGLNAKPGPLGAGEFYDLDSVAGNLMVRSDKPIIVAQYALSNEADPVRVGDPFMTLIAPMSAYVSHATFSTPPMKGYWHHYLSIVCDRESARSLMLNGNLASSSWSSSVPGSEFLVFQIRIEPGTQIISSTGKLAVYSYGFGTGADNFDSYGTYCGPW